MDVVSADVDGDRCPRAESRNRPYERGAIRQLIDAGDGYELKIQDNGHSSPLADGRVPAVSGLARSTMGG